MDKFEYKRLLAKGRVDEINRRNREKVKPVQVKSVSKKEIDKPEVKKKTSIRFPKSRESGRRQ